MCSALNQSLCHRLYVMAAHFSRSALNQSVCHRLYVMAAHFSRSALNQSLPWTLTYVNSLHWCDVFGTESIFVVDFDLCQFTPIRLCVRHWTNLFAIDFMLLWPLTSVARRWTNLCRGLWLMSIHSIDVMCSALNQSLPWTLTYHSNQVMCSALNQSLSWTLTYHSNQVMCSALNQSLSWTLTDVNSLHWCDVFGTEPIFVVDLTDVNSLQS